MNYKLLPLVSYFKNKQWFLVDVVITKLFSLESLNKLAKHNCHITFCNDEVELINLLTIPQNEDIEAGAYKIFTN